MRKVIILAIVLLLSACSEQDELVTSDAFTISHDAFAVYKANVQRVYASKQQTFDVTDRALLDEMIARETMLWLAKERGITPTQQQIEAYAQQTKAAFLKSATSEMHDLHQQLAADLGVSEAAYFTHPRVMAQYRELLTIEQLIQTLQDEGELTDQTLAHYVEAHKPALTIHQ